MLKRIIIPGYEPLGGTSRRYLNTRTGTTISKREYQQLQNQKTFGNMISNEKAAEKRLLARQLELAKLGKKADADYILQRGNRIRSLETSFKMREQDAILKDTGQLIPLNKIRVRGDNLSANKFKALKKELKKLANMKSRGKNEATRMAEVLTELGRRNPEPNNYMTHAVR